MILAAVVWRTNGGAIMGVITEVFLPLSLAFIMFSMGLALTAEDFRRVVVQPKAFAIGALVQVVLLPVIAYIVVLVCPIDPILAIGVMILAACPGGVTSNLLTHLAKGDTALSVTLTAVRSVVGVITIPFIVNFALSQFADAAEEVSLPIADTILGIFLITTVPVAVGMVVKHFASGFAHSFEPRAKIIATMLFIIIVIGAIVSQWENLPRYFKEAGLVTLVLNLIMMAVGFYTARAFVLGRRQGIAISLETGLQNATLAILIGATLLDDIRLAIPGAIYGLLMFVTAGVLVVSSVRAHKNVQDVH
jgi:BASS family bile acid:Na+ symporter